jgi:uncharacterized protein with PIN domain
MLGYRVRTNATGYAGRAGRRYVRVRKGYALNVRLCIRYALARIREAALGYAL